MWEIALLNKHVDDSFYTWINPQLLTSDFSLSYWEGKT